jgi:hypothetical protein
MVSNEVPPFSFQRSKIERAMECLSALHADLDHRDLAPVAQQLAASYARIAELGMPATAVAAAMVSATLNFYCAYDMTQELPALLRVMADLMEANKTVS